MPIVYEGLCIEAARGGSRKDVSLISPRGTEVFTRFVHHAFLHRRLEEELGCVVFDLWVPTDEVLDSAPGQLGHGGEREA
jgi:hypothetical protein